MTPLDGVEDALLHRQCGRRGHEIGVPVEPVRLAGDQVPVTNELANSLDHCAALEALDLEAECARQDGMG
mgnify:CR=1 FL=1